jgi:hypothetical protein
VFYQKAHHEYGIKEKDKDGVRMIKLNKIRGSD